jgi:hypothetical protein
MWNEMSRVIVIKHKLFSSTNIIHKEYVFEEEKEEEKKNEKYVFIIHDTVFMM